MRDVAARGLAIAAKKEIKELQGTWHSTSTETAGVRQSGENKADRHFFSGDQWTCKDGDALVQIGTIKIIEVSDKLVKIDFHHFRGLPERGHLGRSIRTQRRRVEVVWRSMPGRGEGVSYKVGHQAGRRLLPSLVEARQEVGLPTFTRLPRGR